MKKQHISQTGTFGAELHAKCDQGVDLSAHIDLRKAVRLGRTVQRVNVESPVDLLREIDQEARLGWIRQTFIKVRVIDSLGKSPTL